MREYLQNVLRRPPVGWWDILDILIVSILIYEFLKLIRGTRAVQMAAGSLLIVGLFYVSRLLPLQTVNWMIRNMNQPDRALEQFDKSLAVEPTHSKTLLNIGIVRAFGKQDLDGATQAWQQVIKIAPDSPEGQAAKRALDSLKSAHPGTSATPSGF